MEKSWAYYTSEMSQNTTESPPSYSEGPPSYDSKFPSKSATNLLDKETSTTITTNPRPLYWGYCKYKKDFASYWLSKTTKPRSLSLGISNTASNSPGGPDSYFTCLMQPRCFECSRKHIEKICIRLARHGKAHRGHKACKCGFKELKEGQRSTGKCGQSRWCWLERSNAVVVRRDMEEHDRFCGCGCFEKLDVFDRFEEF